MNLEKTLDLINLIYKVFSILIDLWNRTEKSHPKNQDPRGRLRQKMFDKELREKHLDVMVKELNFRLQENFLPDLNEKQIQVLVTLIREMTCLYMQPHKRRF